MDCWHLPDKLSLEAIKTGGFSSGLMDRKLEKKGGKKRRKETSNPKEVFYSSFAAFKGSAGPSTAPREWKVSGGKRLHETLPSTSLYRRANLWEASSTLFDLRILLEVPSHVLLDMRRTLRGGRDLPASRKLKRGERGGGPISLLRGLTKALRGGER